MLSFSGGSLPTASRAAVPASAAAASAAISYRPHLCVPERQRRYDALRAAALTAFAKAIPWPPLTVLPADLRPLVTAYALAHQPVWEMGAFDGDWIDARAPEQRQYTRGRLLDAQLLLGSSSSSSSSSSSGAAFGVVVPRTGADDVCASSAWWPAAELAQLRAVQYAPWPKRSSASANPPAGAPRPQYWRAVFGTQGMRSFGVRVTGLGLEGELFIGVSHPAARWSDGDETERNAIRQLLNDNNVRRHGLPSACGVFGDDESTTHRVICQPLNGADASSRSTQQQLPQQAVVVPAAASAAGPGTAPSKIRGPFTTVVAAAAAAAGAGVGAAAADLVTTRHVLKPSAVMLNSARPHFVRDNDVLLGVECDPYAGTLRIAVNGVPMTVPGPVAPAPATSWWQSKPKPGTAPAVPLVVPFGTAAERVLQQEVAAAAAESKAVATATIAVAAGAGGADAAGWHAAEEFVPCVVVASYYEPRVELLPDWRLPQTQAQANE